MEIKLGKYRHYKGNEYLVLGIAKHSETEEDMVVYKPLYGLGHLWVRPASMWFEEVEVDGVKMTRFTYLEETEEIKTGDCVLLKDGNEAKVLEVLGSLYILEVNTPNGTQTRTANEGEIEKLLG